MTNDRRKLLTKAIGECWHELEYDRDDGNYFCIFCGHIPEWPNKLNRTFDNWQDFGALWEWATKQEWWTHFIDRLYYNDPDSPENIEYDCRIEEKYIDPIRFPELVAEYLEK